MATAFNFGMLALVFLLQNGTGLILDVWPGRADGRPRAAPGLFFLTLFLQALTMLWLVAAPRLETRRMT